MAGHLIAEEGALTDLVLNFEEGSEWVLGRDPESAGFVLEDPMVSRKHVICKKTPEGFLLENLSAVNPATQNGKIISEPVLLHEGDIIQIGNTFFRFTEKDPTPPPPEVPTVPENNDLATLDIGTLPETRWLIKVVTGPNTGAEFHLEKGKSYTIGKDPSVCDVVFQDLSVSKQHAKITLSEDESQVSIEDLGSKNGVLVQGKPIAGTHNLISQDLISLGTTTFMVIDKEQNLATIVSAPPPQIVEEKGEEGKPKEAPKLPPKDWREMVIPKHYLILAGLFGCFLLISILGLFSLAQSEPVVTTVKHESEQIADLLKSYPDVQFSYSEGSGKLFLTGHVLTAVEKEELSYQLKNLAFIRSTDNLIIIDEYVWQNMNALLATNQAWQGVSIHAKAPGRFVVKGYLTSDQEAQNLSDYLNLNFPYLDRLENQVTVESDIVSQIDSLLIERGFNNVTYKLSNGDIVFSGRVNDSDSDRFNSLMQEIKALRGIRSLQNYVVYTTEESSFIDLSSKYAVTGFSKKDGSSQYVVIDGKILSVGDVLEGMVVVAIQPTMVVLEKDGLKFKINYNLQ